MHGSGESTVRVRCAYDSMRLSNDVLASRAFPRLVALSMPSHQTSPSGVKATLVKIVSRFTISIAFGFVR